MIHDLTGLVICTSVLREIIMKLDKDNYSTIGLINKSADHVTPRRFSGVVLG